METENKDWKPEVGKPAWILETPYGNAIRLRQVVLYEDNGVLAFQYKTQYVPGKYFVTTGSASLHGLHQTPEAALASIKIYDLEGKEVLIPRARDFHDGEMPLIDAAVSQEAASLLSTANAWIGGNGGLPRVKQIPMRTIEEQNVMLSPDGESYLIDKQEYFDWCLRNEDMLCMFLDSKIRGGAAIGGKSEPKQDETCHVCQLTKYERRGKPCTEIRCPNQFVDRGGKSDQREGGC